MNTDHTQSRKIKSVASGSAAERYGLVSGDTLLAIDGVSVKDVFDFKMRELPAQLTTKIQHVNGCVETKTIEKDAWEELGISFVAPLMDQPQKCMNRCLFCFIDQLPKGMRSSLYFKDDDLRLCFLHGNYVTLTNVDDREYARMLSYRMSPLNVSVHTTDPDLRIRMTGNKTAGNIMDCLRQAVNAQIDLNCQIVLCPGINDGAALHQTVTDLARLGENLLSIAVVPVGLTRFREENKLFELHTFQRENAAEIVDYVHAQQRKFYKEMGRRLLFAADEFYIRANRPIPAASRYEGFEQLENGVGLMALRRREFRNEITRLRRLKSYRRDFPKGLIDASRYCVISGTDSASFIMEEFERAKSVLGTIPKVLAVANRFFGKEVTVTGLLTGGDILNAVQRISETEDLKAVLLPDVTLRAGERVFLDDMTVAELEERAKIPIVVYATSGKDLIQTLIQLEKRSEGMMGGSV